MNFSRKIFSRKQKPSLFSYDELMWAIWYADYLRKPWCKLLNRNLTRSRTIDELVRLEEFTDVSSKLRPFVYAEDLLSKYP